MEALRKREQELIKILEAFQRLNVTEDWNILKELLWKPARASIESQLLTESLSPKMDTAKLYRLQGEWERVMLSDVDRVVERLTAELKGIKQSINES